MATPSLDGSSSWLADWDIELRRSGVVLEPDESADVSATIYAATGGVAVFFVEIADGNGNAPVLSDPFILLTHDSDGGPLCSWLRLRGLGSVPGPVSTSHCRRRHV